MADEREMYRDPIPGSVKDEVTGLYYIPDPVVVDEPEETDDVDATPAAEGRAEELGVELAEVEGSGKDGRVTVADVEAAASEDD